MYDFKCLAFNRSSDFFCRQRDTHTRPNYCNLEFSFSRHFSFNFQQRVESSERGIYCESYKAMYIGKG